MRWMYYASWHCVSEVDPDERFYIEKGERFHGRKTEKTSERNTERVSERGKHTESRHRCAYLTAVRARIQYGNDIYSDRTFCAEEKKIAPVFLYSGRRKRRSNWKFNARKAIVFRYTLPVVRRKKNSQCSVQSNSRSDRLTGDAFVFHQYSHKTDADVRGKRSFYIACSLANDTFLFGRTKNPVGIDFDARLAIGTNSIAPVFIHVYEIKFKHVPQSVCSLFPNAF